MNAVIALFLLLTSSPLVDAKYFLTTQDEVNTKKAEMLKEYMRSIEYWDRLNLYVKWVDSDIRFRKSLMYSLNIEFIGVQQSDIFGDEQFTSFDKTMRSEVGNKLMAMGFKIDIPKDLNCANINVNIMQLEGIGDKYIVSSTLQYTRSLLDQKRGDTIRATRNLRAQPLSYNVARTMPI